MAVWEKVGWGSERTAPEVVCWMYVSYIDCERPVAALRS